MLSIVLAIVGSLVLSGMASAADVILRPQPTVAPETITARYGFTLLGSLDAQHLYLVQAPDPFTQAQIDAIVATDKEVMGLEFSTTMQASPIPGGPELTQSIAGILETYTTNYVSYYGGSSWDYYVTQEVLKSLRLPEALGVATGTGTIAVIDTGVDPTHPALQKVLVPGYDFTQELQGYGSEFSDLPTLTQSIAGILEEYAKQAQKGKLPAAPLPPYFGHGTMVAGLVHLTAPTSPIMALKAFKADGSSTLYNIIRAIYYAVDNGARVINMSFIVPQPSKELYQALSYASRKGVIAVSAVGNNALPTDLYPVYPADYRMAFGIGSTVGDKRSTFSNYGVDVAVGAPGEALITTYPGGLYSAVWGTSFSTPLATGSVALFLQRNPSATMRDVDSAFYNGAARLKATEGMGYGRLNIYKSLLAVPVK